MFRNLEMEPREVSNWAQFTKREWFRGGLIALVAGVGGFALGNGHTTQGAISHVSEQLGQAKVVVDKTKKLVTCEHKRADVAGAVANQAVASNFIANVPVPDPAVIPGDCPGEAQVLKKN